MSDKTEFKIGDLVHTALGLGRVTGTVTCYDVTHVGTGTVTLAGRMLRPVTQEEAVQYIAASFKRLDDVVKRTVESRKKFADQVAEFEIEKK